MESNKDVASPPSSSQSPPSRLLQLKEIDEQDPFDVVSPYDDELKGGREYKL